MHPTAMRPTPSYLANPPIHVPLDESSATDDARRPGHLVIGHALAVVRSNHSRADGQPVSDASGALVRQLDAVAGRVLALAERALHHQSPALLDVADHPRGGVHRMDLTSEEPGRHVGRDRDLQRGGLTLRRPPHGTRVAPVVR